MTKVKKYDIPGIIMIVISFILGIMCFISCFFADYITQLNVPAIGMRSLPHWLISQTGYIPWAIMAGIILIGLGIYGIITRTHEQ